MQTATNPQTGERVQWNGSAWVPLTGGVAPPAPMVVGTPKPKEAPSGYRWTQNGGLEPIPGGPAIDKPNEPNLPAGYRMGPNGVAERIPGLPPEKAEGGDDDVKLQQKRAALESLVTQINRVDELYRKGFKDEAYGFLSSLGEYLPTDEAAQLNAAGAGLAEQGLAAFRVPGVGAQSDAELRQFVEANKPSSWDRDVALEEKLRQLRARVDATRAEMGLPPAQWGSQPEERRSDHVLAVTQGNNGGGGPMAPAQDYRTVDDPVLSGLKGEYLRRLAAGQSAGEIVKWAKSAGVPLDAGFVRSVAEQVKFRRANPNVDVSHYDISAFDDRVVPTTGFQRNMTEAAQSAPGAMAIRAGNAVTGNNLDSIVGMTGGNAEQARIAIDDAGRQNPGAALAGDLVGGITAALGGEAALARLGMTPGALRSILADMGYGTVAGAGAADEGSRLEGAGIGAAAGLVGNRAGNAVTRGVGNTLSGVTDPSVRRIVDEGIPTTVGDVVGRSGVVGRMVKGVEDRIAGLSVIGDQINTVREAGIRKFNSKAFDKALEPIGGSVGDKVGEEAVEEAHTLVRQAFSNALRGKVAVPDEEFIRAARGPTERIARNKRVGPEIVAAVEDATEGLFDAETGALSGENMQAFLDALRQLRQGYKNDPLYHNLIKPSIQGIETAVEGMFRRQAPEVMPQFNAAKAAYRRLSTLSDAVNRGVNTEGVFTPGQLGMANRANAKKFDGNIAAASGSAPLHELQRAGQNVLPNKVPDSGTAGRIAVPAGIVAGGAGIGAMSGDAQGGAQAGIGLATLLSVLYSKRGQAMLTAGFAKRPPSLRGAGQAVKKRSKAVARVSATGAVLGTSPDQ